MKHSDNVLLLIGSFFVRLHPQAQALYELQTNSEKLKAHLRELHISSAKEVSLLCGCSSSGICAMLLVARVECSRSRRAIA